MIYNSNSKLDFSNRGFLYRLLLLLLNILNNWHIIISTIITRWINPCRCESPIRNFSTHFLVPCLFLSTQCLPFLTNYLGTFSCTLGQFETGFLAVIPELKREHQEWCVYLLGWGIFHLGRGYLLLVFLWLMTWNNGGIRVLLEGSRLVRCKTLLIFFTQINISLELFLRKLAIGLTRHLSHLSYLDVRVLSPDLSELLLIKEGVWGGRTLNSYLILWWLGWFRLSGLG